MALVRAMSVPGPGDESVVQLEVTNRQWDTAEVFCGPSQSVGSNPSFLDEIQRSQATAGS